MTTEQSGCAPRRAAAEDAGNQPVRAPVYTPDGESIGTRMTGHGFPVSDYWSVPMTRTERSVVRMSVEHSPKPDGQGSDIYLCGECRIGLARRRHGEPLGHRLIHCPNCWALNEP